MNLIQNRLKMNINNKLLEKVLGYKTKIKISCDGLGLSSDQNRKNLLGFLDSNAFQMQLKNNSSIIAVFVTEQLKGLVDLGGKTLLSCEDPRHSYYTLHNYIGKKSYIKKKSVIHRSSKISKKASISNYNVEIGKGVEIEPNATILPDVVIGDNCIIRAGAVLGTVGFEHKRTSKGILSVFHDGKVILYENVEVGANSCIDKGFSFRHTIVGEGTKIDDLVYVAHSVHIGSNCLIVANATIMGSVEIKDNVWIGPSSTIAPQVTIENGGYITLGSVVTKNVLENQCVTGNFAIPHDKFIAHLKKLI
ncbi:MAG: UDP-3-O-(3-hydroxymyristoyl) glucosamine N-acyltransferase [Oligoflexia bacterium]|nr:UDP-3-O-(3-hydroxymyristoyl) glucosamine N-acyltransferase [Oligoflexia bacterium]